MYRHCLFCQGDLGANEVIEHLPIGRRVAFDAEKGRLWVVCRKCERWNLTPFESRWEAIETCEREFRATKLRVSTDNIGLARVGDGLELVRIGDPLRPEMAAWRYGDQFGRRRNKYLMMSAAGIAGVGLLFGGLQLIGVSAVGFYYGGTGVWRGITDRLGQIKVATPNGHLVKIVPSKARKARLQYDPGRGMVELTVKSGRKIITWRDDEARNVAGLVLPRANVAGARKADVQRAVSLLMLSDVGEGDPLRSVLGDRRMVTGEPLKLHKLSTPERLALEMALHEESERRALQGELKELEHRWQEAEEIAAIADSLTVPDSVEEQFATLKAGSRKSDPTL